MDFRLSQLYTRIIGIAFLFVTISLFSDYYHFGFRSETMHKIFHVVLAAIVLKFGWGNVLWWRVFPLTNGLFFSSVALWGWIFPNFGGLDAFNFMDTILHSLGGVSGLVIYFLERQPRKKI